MSGTIMNKIWGAFGMDAEENEEKNYEEVNEEVEEEENKENKLWGRRNNNKVVSLPQTQHQSRPLATSDAARQRNMRRMPPSVMPSVLRMPIVRTRSKTSIRSAVIMLNSATTNIIVTMTAAFTSWVPSQLNISAWSIRALTADRLSSPS